MQLIRRGFSLVLVSLFLLWAGASFADDTSLFASELAEHVQSADPATQSGVDIDSPELPDSPVLVTDFPAESPPAFEIRSADPLPALQSIYPPATSPPPRHA